MTFLVRPIAASGDRSQNDQGHQDRYQGGVHCDGGIASIMEFARGVYLWSLTASVLFLLLKKDPNQTFQSFPCLYNARDFALYTYQSIEE